MKKYIDRCKGIIQGRGFVGLLKFIYKRIVQISGDLVFERKLADGDFRSNSVLDERFKIFVIDAQSVDSREMQWLLGKIMHGENLIYLDGLRKKDCMVAITAGEQVVHTSFVLFETSYKMILNESNPTPLIGNCWTSKDFRGQGLYPHAIVRCCDEMAFRGCERILISCAPDNLPSIAGIKKAGFVLIRRVATVLVLTKLFYQKMTEEGDVKFRFGLLK